MTGKLPADWANMDQLSWLNLRNCSLSGPLPAKWSKLRQLSSIALCQNSLTGTFPATWADMSELVFLNLWNNNLTGTLPENWANMRRISRLELSTNKFTGTLPETWGKMSHLTWLDLGSNQLTGTLPTAWSNLSRLTWLALGSNNLTGTLPGTWSSMNKLISLNLWSNELEGSLPLAWTTMSQLLRLDLSSNKLNGMVPNFTGVSIKDGAGRYIDMSNNSLTGPVPSTILNISVLLLANNSLSGALPEKIEAPDLLMLSIGGNWGLSAPVPDSWWMKEKSCLPRVTVLDVGHLMRDTAKEVTWKRQHCLVNKTYLEDDSGALEATLATVFRAQDKFMLPFQAQSLLDRIPANTVTRMEDLCSNPQVVPVLGGAWGAFMALVVLVFFLRSFLRGFLHDIAVDPARARGSLRLLSDMAAAVAGALYWFDLVTDILQIKDVWGRWPAFCLLAFTVLSFAVSTCSMTLHLRRKAKEASQPQVDMGTRTQLACATFAKADELLKKVSGRLGRVGTAVLCLPLAILCLPLAVLCLRGACIFYCVCIWKGPLPVKTIWKNPIPDMESLIRGYDACNAFLLGMLRMVLLLPLIPILDFFAVVQYVYQDTGVDMLHADEAYLGRYSHMRDITKAVFTSLPTAILTSRIYADGNRPDSGIVYNPKIFGASLVASLLLVMWAWLSTLYVVEVEEGSNKAQGALSWADFVIGIGQHVWSVLLGQTLGDDTGPQEGQEEKAAGSSASINGEAASSSKTRVGSWGFWAMLRAFAVAAPAVGAILLEVYSDKI